MAKILYGVSGEGSGHSSRAKLIAKHLVNTGHDVKIVSYDRGYRNLCDTFDTVEIVGLSIASRDNKVSILKTLTENISKIPKGTKAFKTLRQLFTDFKPDCVFTDFEPSTAYLANHYGIPLISIDNQHRMRYMNYERPKALKKDALMTETIIRTMVPKPWYALITSFHFGKLKNKRCCVFPPLLRPAVLEHKPSKKDHILVYTTYGFESLLNKLKNFPRENFLIYGAKKGELKTNNLHFKEFSEEGFLADLASCKAVIASAGFTLISESLYFKKPYLAFPTIGQFEQQLNAYILDKQGYGRECLKPNTDAIAAFLYQLNDFDIALSNYEGFGNNLMTQKIDDLLANDMALLKTYKRKKLI